MNPWLLTAGLLAGAVCLTHLLLGGREIVRPFLAVERMPGIPRFTMYYCWHLVTITLAGMALAFLLAARPGGPAALAWFATGGAASFAALNFAMNLRFGLKTMHHPQGLLFLPPALCGALGLWFV